jgi:hypothetical protein
MPSTWAYQHKPVLSRKRDGQMSHVLYTGVQRAEPGGARVTCIHQCNKGFRIKTSPGKASPGNYIFMCSSCDWRSTIPIPPIDKTTALGRKQLLKVNFPQKQYPAEWRAPPPQGQGFTHKSDLKIAGPSKNAASGSIPTPHLFSADFKPIAPPHLSAPAMSSRTVSLPAPLVPKPEPPLTSSSLKIMIRVPPKVKVPAIARSKSTSLLADRHGAGPSTSPSTSSEPSRDDLRKRPRGEDTRASKRARKAKDS